MIIAPPISTALFFPLSTLEGAYHKRRKSQEVILCVESTGRYGVPLFNALEKQGVRAAVANLKQVKAAKGNKDATKDSKRIGDLFRIASVKGSFIPAKDIRILRGLTRCGFAERFDFQRSRLFYPCRSRSMILALAICRYSSAGIATVRRIRNG